MIRLCLIPLALCALACADEPLSTVKPAGAGTRGQVRVERIAVAPFTIAEVARPEQVEPDGPGVVRTRVFQALSELTDWEMVPPDEVDRWLKLEGIEPQQADPETIGRQLARSFGAQAIMFGQLRRYSARVQDHPHHADRGAAVWFDLELRLPDGQGLWRGSFHEHQRPISADVGRELGRARNRGFRWVDASRLAREGAQQLIGELAQERGKWR